MYSSSYISNSCYSCDCCTNKNANQTPVYKIKLPDKMLIFIPAYKHKLTIIRGCTILNPNGQSVEVPFTILGDNSVQIESNVSLLNYTLILF